MGNSKIHL